MLLQLYCFSIFLYAFSERLAAKLRSPRTLQIPQASEFELSGHTFIPSMSWLIVSARPPVSAATTGRPHDIASTAVMPKGSYLEGTTMTSEMFKSLFNVSSSTKPRKSTLSATPSSYACFLSRSVMYPQPAKTNLASGCFSSIDGIAPTRISMPFSQTSLPT